MPRKACNDEFKAADASTRRSATAAPSTTKPASPIDPSRAPTIRGEGQVRG